MTQADAAKRAHELYGPSKRCTPRGSLRGEHHSAICLRLQANELEHARDLEASQLELDELAKTQAESEHRARDVARELAALRASLPDLQAHAHGMGQECEAARHARAIVIFRRALELIRRDWGSARRKLDLCDPGTVARSALARADALPNLAEPPSAQVDSDASAPAKPEAR